MSGRKQHYLPKLLLRGFGKQKGNAIHVVTYSIYRGTFATATDNVGAKRYFYSDPSEDSGLGTLDDKITRHESKLAKAIVELRSATPDHIVDSTKAAEAITHLCVRHAHLRKSFAIVVGQSMGTMKNLLSDKDRARRALGLDAQTPNDIIREELNKQYEQHCDQLRRFGITKPMFEQIAFAKAKTDFDANFSKYSPILLNTFGILEERIDSMIRQAHNKTLGRSLAPKTRIEHLKQFTWSVVVRPANSFVLPDCIAVSWSIRLGYQPLIYAGLDSDIVYMPLSHDRLLMGERGKQSDSGCGTLNEVFAACSCDFFIARDHTSEFEQLVPRIGERMHELSDDVVGSAIDKYS